MGLARSAYAAWVNYVFFLLLGAAVACSLPRRWLTAALVVAVCLALAGGFEGLRWVATFRD